ARPAPSWGASGCSAVRCCPSSANATRRPRRTGRSAWLPSSTRSWRASRPRTTRRCRPTTTPSPPSRGRSPTGRAPTTSTSSSTRWPRTPRRATTPSSRTRCADAGTPGVAEARRYPGCVFEHLVDLETELEATLKELLVPRDPNDGKNVIMEIRGAEGGDEANLWAGDLFAMYRRYAELRGWGLEVLSRQPSEMGGFRDITFVVKGSDAWA